ncbi:MAG: hypothetical protein NXI19_07735 [Alphaproteobacteria bacterium]|nr:hypothetical protein [Alphaproteobacteria bacterium]
MTELTGTSAAQTGRVAPSMTGPGSMGMQPTIATTDKLAAVYRMFLDIITSLSAFCARDF